MFYYLYPLNGMPVFQNKYDLLTVTHLLNIDRQTEYMYVEIYYF